VRGERGAIELRVLERHLVQLAERLAARVERHEVVTVEALETRHRVCDRDGTGIRDVVPGGVDVARQEASVAVQHRAVRAVAEGAEDATFVGRRVAEQGERGVRVRCDVDPIESLAVDRDTRVARDRADRRREAQLEPRAGE
jgi:hypothetical protein